MTYQPFQIDRFGGLNLRDDLEEVGPNQALVALNVDLDINGAVRTRDGVVKLNTTSSGDWYVQLIPYGTGLVATRNTVSSTYAMDTISSGGTRTQVGATFTGSSNPGRPVSMGIQPAGASTEQTLAYFPFGSATLRKYDGSAHSASVGEPYFVCVSPLDNRLVQARYFAATETPSGANGSPSTVFFSDPGAPDTYGAGNYVHLRPGDDEPITGAATWREQVFVLKRSAAFVFYGTSTDATGAPIFNYRTIDLPDLCTGNVVAGDQGVYYTTERAVYRTRGGVPEKVSRMLGADMFNSDPSTVNPVSFAYGRLYISYTSDEGTWVYDEAGDYWVFYQYTSNVTPNLSDGARCYVEWGASSGQEKLAFASEEDVYYTNLGDLDITPVTTDDGTAIPWSYQSGWYDLGAPSREKVVREVWVRGKGSPTVSVFTNLVATDANAAAVTLGTSPAYDEAVHRKAYKGVLFSHKLSGSGVARVNSLSYDVRSVREPGLRAA